MSMSNFTISVFAKIKFRDKILLYTDRNFLCSVNFVLFDNTKLYFKNNN